MDHFLQTLKDSLALGSLYALVALGYTMVYGILKFINFAHSDVLVLGAWLTYIFAGLMGFRGATEVPAWAGPVILVLAMVSCGLVGYTIERLAYKPLRSAPRLNVLITAIGVSLLLQNTGQLRYIFGTEQQSIPPLLPKTILFQVGQVPVFLVDVVGMGTALVLMVALDWLIFHTKPGRAMRAVSHDARTASLMGINVDRVISLTFVLGSMLAAAGGFLWVMKNETVRQPADASWVLLGLKAFVAAVVGGVGNIRGAMLGGLAIGAIEVFGSAYIPSGSGLKNVFVFAVLILVLLLRPGGILGKAVAEKV